MKKPEVAIIGYGRFGQFAARHLQPHCTILAADSNPQIRVDAGVKRISTTEAAKSEKIILAVPIGKIRPTLREISPHLSTGTLVIDVCSVKEQPVRWMREILPARVSILGTHPLFGPDSAPRTLRGKSLVLCPIRISARKLAHVTEFLESLGLIVRQMNPDEHDKLMASTLFLTQFLGRGLSTLPLPDGKASTEGYRLLAQIVDTAGRDSIELYKDMYRYNRFARQILERTIRALQSSASGLQPD